MIKCTGAPKCDNEDCDHFKPHKQKEYTSPNCDTWTCNHVEKEVCCVECNEKTDYPFGNKQDLEKRIEIIDSRLDYLRKEMSEPYDGTFNASAIMKCLKVLLEERSMELRYRLKK